MDPGPESVLVLRRVVVARPHGEPDDLARAELRDLGGVLVVPDEIVEGRHLELDDRDRRAVAGDAAARGGVRFPDHPLAVAVVVQDLAIGRLGDRHPPLRLTVVAENLLGRASLAVAPAPGRGPIAVDPAGVVAVDQEADAGVPKVHPVESAPVVAVEVEVVEALHGDPDGVAALVPREPDAEVQFRGIVVIVQPVEVAGRQRGLAEDLVPVLDAAVGQVDALQVLVEQLVEGVDLVAGVGMGAGGGAQEGSEGQQADEAGSHGAPPCARCPREGRHHRSTAIPGQP